METALVFLGLYGCLTYSKGLKMTYKKNGDIYLGKIRIWNQYRQSPPRWLMMLGASSVLFFGWAALQGFSRLVTAIWA